MRREDEHVSTGRTMEVRNAMSYARFGAATGRLDMKPGADPAANPLLCGSTVHGRDELGPTYS